METKNYNGEIWLSDEFLVGYSVSFIRITEAFNSLHPPYSVKDAAGFTSTYRALYGLLSREEKKYADFMVDLLLEGLDVRDYGGLVPGLLHPLFEVMHEYPSPGLAL